STGIRPDAIWAVPESLKGVKFDCDDYIRDEMNKAMDLLRLGNYDAFPDAYRQMATDMLDLIDKEEMILYPTSLKLISDAEFEEMKHGDREIGFFRIDMPDYKPTRQTSGGSVTEGGSLVSDMAALLARHGYTAAGAGNDADRILDVAEGKLTLEQINLLFRHLPVDISYVDENELVKFYTDTPHRVFPRSKGVIGREVRNCHPPKSVHLVEEIIEKFRNGEQSRAEFWINKPDLFIYIVYVAVRDADGRFRGVMEMMQDCTHIRKLEGSRTLLTWDEEQQHNSVETSAETHDGEELTAGTKLKVLLKRYPRLIDDLPTINPKFAMLKTPIAKVMIPVATVKMMSERSDMPLEELIDKLKKLIATY
ncbi:MAG: PAS domain-containing protein, partial [Bacteroidota bacterium]